jgi:hypothetical protein
VQRYGWTHVRGVFTAEEIAEVRRVVGSSSPYQPGSSARHLRRAQAPDRRGRANQPALAHRLRPGRHPPDLSGLPLHRPAHRLQPRPRCVQDRPRQPRQQRATRRRQGGPIPCRYRRHSAERCDAARDPRVARRSPTSWSYRRTTHATSGVRPSGHGPTPSPIWTPLSCHNSHSKHEINAYPGA